MGSALGTNFVPKSASIWSLAAGFEACESENGGNETLPEAPARCAVGTRIHTSSCVREGFVGPEFRYHRTCGRGVSSELLAAASIFSGRVGGFSLFFCFSKRSGRPDGPELLAAACRAWYFLNPELVGRTRGSLSSEPRPPRSYVVPA